MQFLLTIIVLLALVRSISAQASQPAATGPTATATAATQPVDSVPFKPLAHIEKRGSGAISMILIPGLSCDWTVFESFMQRNEDRYTMYAVTLPGFGGSEPPASPPQSAIGLWLDNAAQAVWKLVQDNALEKPIIVGHSLGGHLALRLGIEHPEQVGAIITIDGPPASQLGNMNATQAERLEAARTVASLHHSFAGNQWKTHQRMLAGMMVRNHEYADWLGAMFNTPPAEVTVRYMADYIGSDLREELGKLPDRTLAVIAIATGDLSEPEQKQARVIWGSLFDNAPQATLVFFEHTRHFVQLDRPAELDATISDFLAGREVHDFITNEYDAPPPPLPPPSSLPTSSPATAPSSKPAP